MWPDFTKRENVWLGTSISNQKNAEEYIGKLRESSSLAQYIFLSLEPQIDFVDLAPWLLPAPSIDWVIVGGESKQPNCDPRAFNINWARDAIVQCRAAGVPCFIKQLGSNVLDGRQQLRFEDSHGGDMTEWPEDLRVRECPESFNSKIAAA
jgi:protein gp37